MYTEGEILSSALAIYNVVFIDMSYSVLPSRVVYSKLALPFGKARNLKFPPGGKVACEVMSWEVTGPSEQAGVVPPFGQYNMLNVCATI